MPQSITTGRVKPCLIRMRGTPHVIRKSRSRESTLFQFVNQDIGKPDAVQERKWSGVYVMPNDQNQEAPVSEPKEWWLRIKLDHPHTAIDLIETYKQITGTSHENVMYQIENDNPLILKRSPNAGISA